MFQKNTSKPLESLEDLQDYFEKTVDGLSTYLEGSTGTELMDLEMQIAFLNSYAYKIKKYLEPVNGLLISFLILRKNLEKIRKE